MQHFPEHISFLSDHTEVTLVEELSDKKLKTRMANYRYVKCSEGGVLKGTSVVMGLGQIGDLLGSKLIEVK